MAEFLSKVFIGVAAKIVCEIIEKATYYVKTKIKAKKNDAPPNGHRS